VETVALRLIASGVNEAAVATGFGSQAGAAAATVREVTFDGVTVDTAVLHRREVAAGRIVPGPAIVGEPTATTVVPPGWRVTSGPADTLAIARGDDG
jgi:N-methylhydantoinase A